VAITEGENPMGGIEQLIKVRPLEVATGISKYKWYALARAKKIPTYGCGRALRFKLSEILAWMRREQKG